MAPTPRSEVRIAQQEEFERRAALRAVRTLNVAERLIREVKQEEADLDAR